MKPEVAGSQALLRQRFSPLLPRERLYLCGRRAAEQAEGLRPALPLARPLPACCPRGAASSPPAMLLPASPQDNVQPCWEVNLKHQQRREQPGSDRWHFLPTPLPARRERSRLPVADACTAGTRLYEHSDLQPPQTSPGRPYLHPRFITLDHNSLAGQRGLSRPRVLLQISRG